MGVDWHYQHPNMRLCMQFIKRFAKMRNNDIKCEKRNAQNVLSD